MAPDYPRPRETPRQKQARHALEWWRDYPHAIPLYLVAAGLRLSPREVRRRTGARGPLDACPVARAEALRLHAEVFAAAAAAEARP